MKVLNVCDKQLLNKESIIKHIKDDHSYHDLKVFVQKSYDKNKTTVNIVEKGEKQKNNSENSKKTCHLLCDEVFSSLGAAPLGREATSTTLGFEMIIFN